jgi:hypothetical protein
VRRVVRNPSVAFHSLTRPIHHRLEERVRSHVFLCMLVFIDEDPQLAEDP